MSAFIDYYELLGVPVDASPEAIKTAFKKLALQYHPDIYKGEDAQERMRVLLLAYKTLSDAQERRNYNAHRSEHLLDAPLPRSAYASTSQAMPAFSTSSAQRSTSPGARRDRQRRYAFPDLHQGQAASVDLADCLYRLTPIEADTLRTQGMMRGVAPEGGLREKWYCHRCHHCWEQAAGQAKTLPRFCPKCSALDWPEYLLLRCIHCRAVFESEQIRYEIGSLHYGKGELCPPYELFPLCPYCATARWCPAEDERVDVMRQHLAQRAARLRLIWISIVVIAIAIVGVALTKWH